ncbi:DUF6093 family protein [Streptomyces sp. IBSBF 2435]|uniref:DUF6093 family protein n=1 Tax=Streptomyces sp. IBSBF 2435 TaxID=2903531 RepID=UPI002FDB9D22
MSAADTAAAGRAAAEQDMTDRCRIERTGPVATSADGTDTTPVTVLYDGICRVKPAGTAAVVPSATAAAETWQHKLSIPYAAGAGIRSNDRVVITASDDPTLAGLRLQVRNIDRGTHITARRIWCTEVSR